jgi:hypothetical protein
MGLNPGYGLKINLDFCHCRVADHETGPPKEMAALLASISSARLRLLL